MWAVVLAAGAGARFGERKQYAMLCGRPVVSWSIQVAAAVCEGVVLVAPAEDVARLRRDEQDADVVVPGGATRSDSVRAGLAAVPGEAAVVAVHDAARPLAGAAVWQRVLDAVRSGAGAAVPVVAVTDTIKQVDDAGGLVTLDRSSLVAVQTPQAFRAEVLRRAHAGGGHATDDAALVEAMGVAVVLVEGAAVNLKITTPGDLLVAAALLG